MRSIYWIILVIAAIVVGGYLIMRGGSYQTTNNTGNTSQSVSTGSEITPAVTEEVSPSPATIQNNSIVAEATDPAKGKYLTDTLGRTLYVFDNDTNGTSNCTGSCAQLWPPYTAKVGPTPTGSPTPLPANVSTITRADGTTQYSWNGLPLYRYSRDQKAGDTNGDGVGGVWHIISL